MFTHPIVLREFGPSITVQLDAQQIAEIVAYSDVLKHDLGLRSAPIEFSRVTGGWALSAKHVTGFFSVAGISIEILPKFLDTAEIPEGEWRSALINLILLANEEVELSESVVSGLEPGLPIPDLLAELLIRSYVRGAQRGLPRGYAQTEEIRRTVIGRIVISDSSRAKPALGVLCRFDELTDDILPNRLIGWAADTLVKSVYSSRRSQRLREIAAELPRLGVRPSKLDVYRIHLSPQHQALQPALLVARLLLDRLTFGTAAQELDVPGAVWNSATVFERLVFKLVRRACRPLGMLSLKRSERFGDPMHGEPHLRMTPDIQLRDAHGLVGILDSKYKVLGSQPLPEDTYQVLSGAKVLDAPIAGLIYPGTDHVEMSWMIRGEGLPVRLYALIINLGLIRTPAGFRRSVGVLTSYLRSLQEVAHQFRRG